MKPDTDFFLLSANSFLNNEGKINNNKTKNNKVRNFDQFLNAC